MSAADDPGARRNHFVDLLGLHTWATEDGPRGRARIRPSMWTPGTQRPRLGVIATMVDMIGGLIPQGLVTPTVDLRVSAVDSLPSEGVLELATDTIKLGRTLLVSETLVRVDRRLVVRATTTFLGNVQTDHSLYRECPEPEVDITSFDSLMGPDVVDGTTLELAPRAGLSNDERGTIQGGVQATFAELVAEHALGESGVVTDIDIHYLSAMKVGPLRGSAEVLGSVGGTSSVRVMLTDAGAEDRVVSYAAVSASTA